MRLSIKLIALAATAATAATVGGSMAMAADDAPAATSIVEDYSYPDAAQILVQHGVKLNSGDGHILYVDCAAEGDLIKIESYQHADFVCFQLHGPHGYLSLEIGETVFVYSETNPLQATVQLAGETQPEQPQAVAPDKWISFGEAANQPAATLLELRA